MEEMKGTLILDTNQDTKNTNNKEIFWCDFLAWFSFGAMIFVRGATSFIGAFLTKTTGATLNAIAVNYEANPITALLMNLDKVGFLATAVILPSFGMAIYYFMRYKAKQGKVDIPSLQFLVNFVAVGMFINVINDASYMLGRILQ